MPSHKIKADVKLAFRGWIDPLDVPELALVGTVDELNLSTVFGGKIELSATKVYEILKESKMNGRRPLFVMEILDDEPVRIPGMKDEDKDPDQGKLDLDPDTPKPMTPKQQEIIDEERRQDVEDHQKNVLTQPRNVS